MAIGLFNMHALLEEDPYGDRGVQHSVGSFCKGVAGAKSNQYGSFLILLILINNSLRLKRKRNQTVTVFRYLILY